MPHEQDIRDTGATLSLMTRLIGDDPTRSELDMDAEIDRLVAELQPTATTAGTLSVAQPPPEPPPSALPGVPPGVLLGPQGDPRF